MGNGHKIIIKLLFKRGAKFKSEIDSGQTPLSLASENGHETIVKLLLGKGAKSSDDASTIRSAKQKRVQEKVVCERR